MNDYFYRFNSLLPYESPQEMDKNLEEFTEFQLLREMTFLRMYGKRQLL